MRIAYLSRMLSIHDYRFLAKLVDHGYETWLITSYPRATIPENIRTLPHLKIVRLQAGKRWDVGRLDHRWLPWQMAYMALRRLRGPQGLLEEGHEGQALSREHPLIRLGSWTFSKQYEQLLTLLQQIQPDVVHAGWVQADGFLAAVTGFRPLLLMPWGSDILLHPKRRKVDRVLARYVIQRSDMITCDCEVVKEEILTLADYPPEKIVVFPWGINLHIFQRNPTQRALIREQLGWADKKIIIMTRSFRPVYAVDDFLRALPPVVAAEPDVRVIMVGAGGLEEKMKALAAELGLTPYLTWVGYVNNAQLPDYLNAADLYVSSSLSDGTPTSHLEAMACGLPLVVTDVPSTFEWVTDGVNGRIAPRSNVPALTAAMLDLLQNPALCQLMGERNVAVAQERADWDKNFAKLESMYQALSRSYQQL